MSNSPTILADEVARKIRKRILDGMYPAETLMPTERALAAEFNVSRSTVSAALSKLAEMGLLEQTRGRGTMVLAVEQRPAPKRVAVISPRVEDHFSKEGYLIVEGAADRLKKLGYAVDHVPFYALPQEAETKKWSDRLIRMDRTEEVCRTYEGVVFLECTDPLTQEAAYALEADHHPMIIANLEFDMPFSATRVDHYAVFRKAADMLFAFGHRDVALISRPYDLHFYGKAHQGLLDAAKEAGVQIPEHRLIQRNRCNALDGYLAMREVLEGANPPTAVLAGRDSVAEGVVHAVEEAGMEIGRDISIIGYDDVSWQVTQPFLTTFHEPCYELGVEAANMLDERLTYGWRPYEHRLLDAPLVLRQSAGPAPRKPA